MRIRILLETLAVIGAVGLLLEIAGGHMWLVVAAGVTATLWLIGRYT